MGTKSGKYAVERDGSVKNRNKDLSLLVSDSNAPIAEENSRKEEASRPALIHQSSLADAFSSKMNNLTLVWLDTEFNTRPSNIDTQIKLKNVINYVRTFDHIDTCQEYMEQIDKMNTTNTINQEQLFLIISSALAPTVISEFHPFAHVKNIYIYGKSKMNKKASEELLQKYPKIKGIFPTSQALLARITQDKI